MKTAGVNGAVNLMNNLTTNVGSKSVGPVGASNFQNVLDSQSEKTADTNVRQQDNSKTSVVKSKQNETAKTEDVSENKEAVSDTDDKDVTDTEKVENTEEVMEVLMTAVEQVVDSIVENFDVSKEELSGLLDEMGLVSTDLLDSGKLGEVLLKIGGAGDSLALLTNEELYMDFNQVMNELNQVLEGDSGINNMSMEELRDAIAGQLNQQQDVEATLEATQETAGMELPADDEPVVELKIDKPDGSTQTEDVSTDEGDSLGTKTMVERTMQSDSKAGNEAKNFGERHSEAGGGNNNPLLQNIQNNSLVAETGETARAGLGAEVNTQDIMRQIMDYMKIQVKPDMSNLEMQLHPASLGTIRIHLASNGGVVSANFIAQNEAVKAALETQMVQLKESFAEQGVKVDAIEVTVQTHQFEQNLEQNQNGGQNSQDGHSASRRTRRIQLDDLTSIEEIEEDDRLAAEMMAANGGTVDYTA